MADSWEDSDQEEPAPEQPEPKLLPAAAQRSVAESWEESEDEAAPEPSPLSDEPTSPVQGESDNIVTTDGDVEFRSLLAQLGPGFVLLPPTPRRSALLSMLRCSEDEAIALSSTSSSLLVQALALRVADEGRAVGHARYSDMCCEALEVAMLLQTTEKAELLSRTTPLQGKVKLQVLELLSWWRCALGHVILLNDVLRRPLDIRPCLMADGVVVSNC